MLARIEPIISGWCDDEFLAVRDAFRQNFIERGEVGAALCVIRHGEVIVDLRGGWVDEARTRPWAEDTLVNYYSVGKAIVATLVLQLVDRGIVTLDTRVAEIWPEFATGGKHDVTIRHALCHRAGVPAIRQQLTDDDLFDWPLMTDALAATETWWPIDTRHAYHTNTFGHLTGEIIRRATGEMPGAALRRVADEIDADIWIGVPDEHHPRCADVIWAPSADVHTPAVDATGLEGDALMNVLAHFNPPAYSSIGLVNTSAWRSAEVPSTNGHGTAQGLATFYSALLQPDRLLSPDLLAAATQPQSSGPCPILGEDVVFGLGFAPTTPRRPLGPNQRSFGHFGTGGALGFADPDTGIAFGYVMSHVIPRWQSSRNRALIDSLYGALDTGSRRGQVAGSTRHTSPSDLT